MIPEKKHLENLLYIRDLLKIDIDTWTEENKNGNLPLFPDLMDLITDLSIVEECIAGLYSKCEAIKALKIS